MESQRIELKLPSGKDYLSYSSAKHLKEHPSQYLSYINDKFVPNEGMIFGKFYEALLYNDVEELEKFHIVDNQAIIEEALKQYGKPTDRITATKVYKELYQEAIDATGGKDIITEEQHMKAQKMGVIMQESGVFDDYLNGKTQVTIKGEIDTGRYIVNVLLRADAVLGNGAINDLKTTSQPLSGFGYQAKKMDYDIQAYITMEKEGLDEFSFIVQRTEGLFDVGVFTVTRDSKFFESGRDKLNRAVANYISWLSPEAEMLEKNPSNYVYYQSLY